MTRPSDASVSHEVVCPHCKKAFSAELLGGGSARQRGFKCPHCRLFVASDRAEDAEEPGPRG